eukprot:3514241-Rhodomonas_salina.2
MAPIFVWRCKVRIHDPAPPLISCAAGTGCLTQPRWRRHNQRAGRQASDNAEDFWGARTREECGSGGWAPDTERNAAASVQRCCQRPAPQRAVR